uniref:Uncharacterized protein n=1 Tax=Oryza nivara TaxID=4536 RepID=A0A0E0FS69_ORYNI
MDGSYRHGEHPGYTISLRFVQREAIRGGEDTLGAASSSVLKIYKVILSSSEASCMQGYYI